MFFGEYQHSLDAKGRVIIPSKHRAELGEKFMMTQGEEKCIYIFPMDVFQKMIENIKNLPLSDKEGRIYSRRFFAKACECETDKQGRVVVSNPLRDYAGLTKDVVLLGVNNRLELWDKDAWTEYEENQLMSDSSDSALADKYGI